jgi:lipopolysaccharide biosynthesis protein
VIVDPTALRIQGSSRVDDVSVKAIVRAICFYLPQFHPIPENDLWWGEGFTEWTNVASATPRFKGHYQPHLPGALGFYDLRLEESRIAQAALAKRFGIHGFCYYHYWFSGQRLLGRPLDDMLASGKPDFPFCLCWANETWSRTWSGREHDVLIRQEYSDDDHDQHIAWLSRVFNDSRYIRVNGRPLFLIYRPDSIPDLAKVLDRWKSHCMENIGVTPFFCAVSTGFSALDDDKLIEQGFDAIVNFEPNRRHFPAARNATGHAVSLARKILPLRWYDALRNSKWLARDRLNTVVDYTAYVDASIERRHSGEYLTFPAVFPSWDNSARKVAATIIQNDSPMEYARWLDSAISRVSGHPDDSQIIFINAWNEWGEGCHLEPDSKNGMAFLDATKKSLSNPRDVPGGGAGQIEK